MAAKRQTPTRDPDQPDWWNDARLWRDPGRAHSPTEYAALANLCRSAARGSARTAADSLENFGVTVLREVLSELRQARAERRHLPLRELHTLNGLELRWIVTGKGSEMVAVLVALEA